MTERKLTTLICFLLAVLTLAAYWQVTGHGFVNFDDDDYITANPRVKAGLTVDGIVWAFTEFHEAHWHPLTWVSHMLDSSLFGVRAEGRHAVNLILHIANTLLLFLILQRMTGFAWRSAFVAALFAVHPLHVESVAWITERKDVLSTLFWMLTMLAYVRYTERPGIGRYALVFVLLALGLTAKPMLVMLPFILLLLDFWPLGRADLSRRGGLQRPPEVGNSGRIAPVEIAGRGSTAPAVAGRPSKASPTALIVEKIPLIGLAILSCAVTFAAGQSAKAVGSLDQYTPGIRVANTLVAYAAYLAKMIYPAKLSVFYPHPGSNLPAWQVVGSAVFLIAVTTLVVRAARTRPCLAVGWFWYGITLLPVIGLVQVGLQSMADRYTYVPLIGVFVMLTWSVSDVLVRMGERKKGRVGDLKSPIPPFPYSPILSVLILAALLPITWKQVGYWRDSKTLFGHALAITKDNAIAENNLGLALVEDGKFDEAIGHHRCAVEIKPGWADGRYSLGIALLKSGKADEAVQELESALAIDPNHSPAHNNLGAALMELGDLSTAIEHIRRAIEIRPDYAQAHNNLGTAYSYQRKWNEAVREWTKAVELDPSLADAHYNLAFGLAEQKRFPEAISECRKALAIKPDWVDAKNNLAWYLATAPKASRRNVEEAVRVAEDVCRATKYSTAQYMDTLAAAYASAGRWDDAVRTARKAIDLAEASLQPDLASQIEAELKSYTRHRLPTANYDNE